MLPLKCFNEYNEFVVFLSSVLSYLQMDLDQSDSSSKIEEIKKRIISGEYKCKQNEAKGRKGAYYRIMDDVYDENDKKLPNVCRCRVCSEVIECTKKTGTSPLNRHADKCDPPPSTSKQTKKDNHGLFRLKKSLKSQFLHLVLLLLMLMLFLLFSESFEEDGKSANSDHESDEDGRNDGNVSDEGGPYDDLPPAKRVKTGQYFFSTQNFFCPR